MHHAGTRRPGVTQRSGLVLGSMGQASSAAWNASPHGYTAQRVSERMQLLSNFSQKEMHVDVGQYYKINKK